jgi:hypothetical protein
MMNSIKHKQLTGLIERLTEIKNVAVENGLASVPDIRDKIQLCKNKLSSLLNAEVEAIVQQVEKLVTEEHDA